MLRCATWLAPGLPLELYEVVTEQVALVLDDDVTLESHTESSGPDPDDDPFARDEIDLGFVCTPSFRMLRSVKLVGAAPVFDDPRNEGRPVYFAELVARDDMHATSLLDLKGVRIGFNDDRSMSGLTALRARMEELDLDESFATLVRTGGHHESLRQLEQGDIDAASIDSNTLLYLGGVPAGLRVVETWGPLPVQPVVVRASLTDKTRDVITDALLALHDDPVVRARLRRLGVIHFAPVTEADYR